MTPLRTRLDALGATLPGAGKSDPRGGGHDAWTVGARTFGRIGAMTPGLAVKTPDIETAAALKSRRIARRPIGTQCKKRDERKHMRTTDGASEIVFQQVGAIVHSASPFLWTHRLSAKHSTTR